MWSIRIAIVVLVIAAIGISVVPILVMLDLLEGGTGWGMCPGGLEGCESPYTAPFEFLVILSVGLFLVILAIRLVMKLARRLQAESFQVSAPESQPPPG
jgi:hypothetical protein